MRISRIKKAFLVFLIALIGLLLLTFIIINLPFSRSFLTQKVNSIFISSRLPVQIGSVTKIFPGSVSVEEVIISGRGGDTIVFAGSVQAGFKTLSLLKKRLILTSVELEKARIRFTRNNEREQLNIVDAFSNEDIAATSVNPVEEDNQNSPWEISVREAGISDLHFRMVDSVGGIFINQDVKRIRVEAKKMSLTGKIIIARSLEVEGLTGSITLKMSTEKDTTDSELPWNIGLEELNAGNINFVFDDPVNKLKLDLLAGEIKIKAGGTDINKKKIDFTKVSFSHTSIALHTDNPSTSPANDEIKSSAVFPWTIRGDAINLEEVSVSMAKYSDTADYNPLSGFSVLGLNMSLSGIRIDSAVVNAELQTMKFDLGNSFSIREMTGSIASHSGNTRIDLSVNSANSKLNIIGSAAGNLFEILDDPASTGKASVKVSGTSISATDIFYFKPDFQKNAAYKTLADQAVLIDGEIQLDGSRISIPDFTASRTGLTDISLKGTIDNVFSPQMAICDLKINVNNINCSSLKNILKDFQSDISIPDFKHLSFEGTIADTLISPHFSLNVLSDLGKIELQGSFDTGRDRFAFKSLFRNLNIGKILNNQMVGSITGSAEFTGSGIKRKAIDAEGVVLVDSVLFNGYNYQDAKIECSINQDKYHMNLSVADSSLALKLAAEITREDHGVSIVTKASFLANLFNLKFYSDTLVAEGNLEADLSMKEGKSESNAVLSDLRLTTPRESALLSRITASMSSDSVNTDIATASDFYTAHAHIESRSVDPGQFLKSYTSYLKSLFDGNYTDSLNLRSSLPVINGKISMSYHNVLRILIPDTTLYFRNLSFTVNTDIKSKTINYGIIGKGLRKNTFQVGNLNASLIDSSATIDLKIMADTCVIGLQPLNNIQIKSHFSGWQSLTNLSIADKDARLIYNIGISSEKDSNNVILRIPSGALILNGVIWKMDSPDFLTMDLRTKKLMPSMRMHTDSSSLALLSSKQEGWDNYNLELSDVKLVSFLRSDLFPGKPALSISGFIRYSENEAFGNKITTQLQLSDIKWSDLSYNKITLNSLLVSDTTGNFKFDIDTRLDSSEIKISGKKEVNSMRNIQAIFNKIPVNTVQPFVEKYISDLSGNVSGEFNLTTKEDVNTMSGDLAIDGGRLRINTLNSVYKMPHNRISFTGEKMIFKDFEVLDSLDNKLSVNGSIDIRNKNSVNTDLEINSSNLQVLNKKKDRNSSFYGDVFIDSKLSVRGPVLSPVLKGKIILVKGTDIYFRQMEDLSLSGSESVLTFVNNKPAGEQDNSKNQEANTIYNKTSIESIVEIDPSTRINIELSEKMFNINMTIQGGGELTYNMLVNSQVNLSGKYEISDGSANLKMVGWPIKAFKLTKGGFIRWDGKMDDPDLKLEAISTVKSSYVNPVDNKERYVDFDVTLKISDRVSAMDVSFTINTPDPYLMSIINTMSPEEQMRQAITILLFEYIDLPGISTSSNYVSEQVNQMVASQLNQLTKTTINGVDISFGIDTYTSGTSSGGQQSKTSLSYEVKRNIFNDRAKVEFSGILSETGNKSQTSNTSLNNFTFEYRIDSAGTKFLKVYNEHTYEDVFEGDVVKTGIGFTYRKSYPSLGDIWKREDKVIKPKNGAK